MSDRLVVGAAFVGWDTIKHIVDSANEGIIKLLILSLFLTGGRTQEVLSLKKSNFDFTTSKHSIIVNNMRLDKKFKVTDKIILKELTKRGNPKEKWETEKINATRDAFPILKLEPLTKTYENMIKEREKDALFPYFSRQISYYHVRNAGENAGIRVSDHWFRGQRASQLQEEYLFRKEESESFFGWRKPVNDMYRRYGSTTWKYLEVMMARGIQERAESDNILAKYA